MHSLIVDFLTGVQRELETQNGLAPLPNVDAFLITSEERRALSEADSHEEVFVGEDTMGVFIHEEVLDRLAHNRHSLDDYCVAAEGVSHFIYLMDRAERGYQVTLLELELQAEVDKFVHLSRKLPLDNHTLLETLFERYSLHAHLSAEERERYDQASRAAARFCHKLTAITDRAAAVRHFFTRPLSEKLRLATR